MHTLVVQFIQISAQMPVLYSAVALFSWVCCKLFFRDINPVSQQNVPDQGPTILYGNHNNLFVDGMLLMTTVKRTISFLAAKVSMEKPIVGQMMKAADCVPVKRQQDQQHKEGTGKLSQLKGMTLIGQGTKFTELNEGATIYIDGKTQLKVKQIKSDTKIILEDHQAKDFNDASKSYKYRIKIHFEQLFKTIWEELHRGKCIGIFPEGHSHDTFQIHQFKAGIALMALGAMDKNEKPVRIVPCGFNYYNQDKFRSKVFMEFGPMYEIPMDMVELFRRDKQQAVHKLLQMASQMLKAVTIQLQNPEEVFALFRARQLYSIKVQRKLTPAEKLQLNRRFAKGFQIIRNQPNYQKVYNKLLKFSRYIQVTGLPLKEEIYSSNRFVDVLKFLFYFGKCFIQSFIVLVKVMQAFPGIILFGPATALINFMAENKRQASIEEDRKKNGGYACKDIVSSQKIKLSLIIFPIINILHTVIFYFSIQKYTHLSKYLIIFILLVLFLLQPFYVILLIKSYDSFTVSWQKVKYMFIRLFKKDSYEYYNRTKKELQEELLEVVEEVGDKVLDNFEKKRIIKKEELKKAKQQADDKQKND